MMLKQVPSLCLQEWDPNKYFHCGCCFVRSHIPIPLRLALEARRASGGNRRPQHPFAPRPRPRGTGGLKMCRALAACLRAQSPRHASLGMRPALAGSLRVFPRNRGKPRGAPHTHRFSSHSAACETREVWGRTLRLCHSRR